MKTQKLVSRIAAVLGLTAIPLAAFAATYTGPTYTGQTTITTVTTFQSGYAVYTVATTTPSSGWSPCNTNHQFVVNANSITGQALFQTVLTAEQQHKNVFIVGAGTCNFTTVPGTEDANYVQINP